MALDELITEARAERPDYDLSSTAELVALMNREDETVPGAVGVIAAELAAAIVAVGASGRTPYVVAAVESAVAVGALTVAIVAVRDSELAGLVEHELAVVVGPEFVAGSTRLKAGTAQKLLLNTISTVTMIRL